LLENPAPIKQTRTAVKYTLVILLFFEVLLGILLFVPVFADENPDRDSLSRSNLDMVMRTPEEMEAEHARNRRNRWIFKSAAGLLLAANSGAIAFYVKRLGHTI
jgi:hypothetical protein